MLTTQELARGFGLNTDHVKRQLGSLSHADSLIQPSVQGNCLNWVLGHIVSSRSDVLKMLGQPGLMTEAQYKRYGYGSQPVCADGDDILRMETLLDMIARSQPQIESALTAKSEEELAAPVESFMGTTSVGFRIFFSLWHETYHLGQTELLREMALAAHA